MKKTILLLVLLLLMQQLVAQLKTIKLHGLVQDTSIRTLEITHLADTALSNWHRQKINVVNGKFSTTLQILFPTKLDIRYGNKYFDKNYISGDTEMLIDTAGKIHFKGSHAQEEYEKEFSPFVQSNEQLYDSLMSFYRRYGGEFPKAVNDSVILLREKYGRQRAELLGNYISLHPNSYIALWDIYYFASIPASYKYFTFEKLFSSFSQEIQQGSFANALKEKIAASGRLQPGQIFPDEFFRGYEQTKKKIKDNCRYYLIDFWYSYCGPCIAAFPRLSNIYNQFQNRGFDIISISVDAATDEKNYTTAIKKYNLTWGHVWDKDGILAKKFNVNAYPTYILLDKNDRIIHYGIRSNQLETFLKEHL